MVWYGMLPHATDFRGRVMMDEYTDSVRQAIICAGDTTLEAANASYAEDERLKEAVGDGVGTVHPCRSWAAIKEFMTVRRPSNLSSLQHGGDLDTGRA
jgi:hypothetical protein